MNANRLLAYYEAIAEAPDAIARLRRFVRELAVRGKLMSQNDQDEPASELLKRIAKARSKLEAKGILRKHKDVEPKTLANAFPVPNGWLWTDLQNIARARMGKTILSNELSPTGIPVFSAGAENKPWGFVNSSDLTFRRGAVIISARGGIGYPKIPDFDEFISTQTTIACESFENDVARYLCLTLETLPDWKAMTSQTAIPMITVKQIHAIAIPLPPLAEQHRIVAKVDELMGLCDRLEEARTGREAARDRLAAASLARLNAPDPETFQDDARFALDALPALTTRPDQIKALRQTILNLAVRGKLVPQDAKDEPASKLLKVIAKTRATSERRQKELPEINADDLGELPTGWCAAPLIALGDWAIGSGFPKNEQGRADGPYFFLKVSDMNLPGNEKFITTANNMIDDPAAKRMRAAIHPPGTIIFPKIGGAIATNKRRILTHGSAIDNNCLGIIFSPAINNDWAYLIMTTLDFTLYQAGSAVPALQQGSLAAIPIALPPLAEQRRIVAKVDELMAICDQLEASLTARDLTRRSLLDALLAGALVPVEDRALEAAQ